MSESKLSMEQKKNLKSVKVFGSVEAYERQLAKQRTREYKDKRNARCRKKKIKDKLKDLTRKEVEIELELERIKTEKTLLFKELS